MADFPSTNDLVVVAIGLALLVALVALGKLVIWLLTRD